MTAPIPPDPRPGAGPQAAPRPAHPVRLLAHRGASRAAPENTLAAIDAAHAAGAIWVEFDVSLLGDGTAVLHHDATLERCTDRAGPLSALALADLEGIDAGGWFGAAFRGERMATLEAALDRLAALGLSGNLELKPHGTAPGPLVEATVAALAARPWTARGILVSSFDAGALAVFAAARPDQPRAVIHHDPPPDWLERARDLGATALHMDYRHLTPAHLERALAAEIDLRVFTANDPAAILAHRRPGLAGVITDDPALYLADAEWRTWAAA